MSKKPQDVVDSTLVARGRLYGSFDRHAEIAQELKAVMRGACSHDHLSADQWEALEMIQHKVARILNGNPNYKDSWVDIAGYARLVHQRLTGA